MEENLLDRLACIIGKVLQSSGYYSGNGDSYSNFLRRIKRKHVEEYDKIQAQSFRPATFRPTFFYVPFRPNFNVIQAQVFFYKIMEIFSFSFSSLT
jgi:hypothetical protein